MPAQIRVMAAGRTYIVPTGLPLPDFLKARGLQRRLVRVERDGLVLTPDETVTATLENGDVLEIVKVGPGN